MHNQTIYRRPLLFLLLALASVFLTSCELPPGADTIDGEWSLNGPWGFYGQLTIDGNSFSGESASISGSSEGSHPFWPRSTSTFSGSVEYDLYDIPLDAAFPGGPYEGDVPEGSAISFTIEEYSSNGSEVSEWVGQSVEGLYWAESNIEGRPGSQPRLYMLLAAPGAGEPDTSSTLWQIALHPVF